MKNDSASVDNSGFSLLFKRLDGGLSRIVTAIRKYKLPLVAFLLPLTVRAITELMAGPYPIGYDTITAYVPFMRDWAIGNTSAQFNLEIGGWLLYVLFGVAFVWTRVDPVTIVKIAGPILYGILGSSEYFFAKRVFHWNSRKAFLFVFIASTYFVSLRISWDLFRNTLGLALMLSALGIGANIGSNRRLLVYSALIFLTGITHVLVAVLLISVILVQSILAKLDWRRIAAAIPGAALCVESVWGFQTQGVPAIIGGNSSVQSLSLYVYSAYMFLPLIPVALVGMRSLQSSLMKSWLLVCGLGIVLATTPLSLSAQLVSPDRWALMMFLPIVAFSTEGFTMLRGSLSPRMGWKPIVASGWILMLLILSIGYVGLQAETAVPYYAYFVPTSMLQSTVPLHNSQDVASSFRWLSANTQPGSVIVATNPIYGWAREYFTGSERIMEFYSGTTLQVALQTTLHNGFSKVYTVWWANGQGWYGQATVPPGFKLIHQAGQFGVFLYDA